ncbi:MAG TPA: hypothetical protein VLV86_18195 [Vicinamibacterales bacterium]|nr:hypothetical protein [Vicinamibacterales bacterium]
MDLLNQSPAERAMSQQIDKLVAQVATALDEEANPRVIAVVLFQFMQHNPEVCACFEALCTDWVLPMTLRNSRSIYEGDRALNAALRRTR